MTRQQHSQFLRLINRRKMSCYYKYVLQTIRRKSAKWELSGATVQTMAIKNHVSLLSCRQSLCRQHPEGDLYQRGRFHLPGSLWEGPLHFAIAALWPLPVTVLSPEPVEGKYLSVHPPPPRGKEHLVLFWCCVSAHQCTTDWLQQPELTLL